MAFGRIRGVARILDPMTKLIARVNRAVTIESVVYVDAEVLRHSYRLVGGPDDGRQFDTLAEVSDYVLAHREDDVVAC